MDTTPVLFRLEDWPTERRYLEQPSSYALALAPAIHMALRTRNIDDGKQTSPPPSIPAIERWIVSTFPPHRPCYYRDIFWGITEQVYPPVHWRELSGSDGARLDQAYEVLRAGRPVLVSLSMRRQEWQFFRWFFWNGQHAVLTRDIYSAQPESDDTRWSPYEDNALLFTGYDPTTGVCTFIDPSKPKTWGTWGNNGPFKVEDAIFLTTEMPMVELRFYEFYCHPGKVLKCNRFGLFLKFMLGVDNTFFLGRSLVPSPFAEYQKKKKKLKKENKKNKKGRTPGPGSFATLLEELSQIGPDKRGYKDGYNAGYNDRAVLDMIGFRF